MRIPDMPTSRRSAMLAGAALVGGSGLEAWRTPPPQRALSLLSLRVYRPVRCGAPFRSSPA
jgi:hypothetical protein